MRKINLDSFRVATSETAREINRRIALNFLRTHQPISRADLARRSGLQFSTVSLIVEDLIAGGWAVEGAATSLPRGRKPKAIHLNSRKLIAALDARPRFTTLGIANLQGEFLAVETMPTPPDARRFLREAGARLKAMIGGAGGDFAGVGAVMPGRIDTATGRLALAPNIGWRDLEVRAPLERATGLPVTPESAPNACALGEIWFGRHADNVQDLVAVAVSEGCGAGIVMNGQLVLGPTGMAGEFGHVCMDENGPPCGCGKRGCWEVFASNRAALRYHAEALARRPGGRRNGGELTFDGLLELAENNDRPAREALDRMARHLGAGIAMLTTGLAPSLIVVVGEVARAWPRVGPIVLQVVAERVQPHLATRIVPTDDLDQPRLRGGVAAVLHNHLGAPLVA